MCCLIIKGLLTLVGVGTVIMIGYLVWQNFAAG